MQVKRTHQSFVADYGLEHRLQQHFCSGLNDQHRTRTKGLNFGVAEVLLGDAEDAQQRHPSLFELMPGVPAECADSQDVLLKDVLQKQQEPL